MTNRRPRGNDALSVMPVATGIQDSECRAWIPAYAGMTNRHSRE
jgi:hypothetical protein